MRNKGFAMIAVVILLVVASAGIYLTFFNQEIISNIYNLLVPQPEKEDVGLSIFLYDENGNRIQYNLFSMQIPKVAYISFKATATNTGGLPLYLKIVDENPDKLKNAFSRHTVFLNGSGTYEWLSERGCDSDSDCPSIYEKCMSNRCLFPYDTFKAELENLVNFNVTIQGNFTCPTSYVYCKVTIANITVQAGETKAFNMTGSAVFQFDYYTTLSGRENNIGDVMVYQQDDCRGDYNYGKDTEFNVINSMCLNKYSYMKWDISSIQKSLVIKRVVVSLLQELDNIYEGKVGVYHVYKQDWDEGLGQGEYYCPNNQTLCQGITWNTQPCGENFDNAANCNLTVESTVTIPPHSWTRFSFDVTNMFLKDYANNRENFSMALRVLEPSELELSFWSKETIRFGMTDLMPVLNITYET